MKNKGKLNHWLKPFLTALSGLGLVSLSGCSFNNHPYDPNDPLQTVNRASFAFNQKFDKYVLKPTAQVYKGITPAPLRTGVNNFFMNLNEIPTSVNYLLQGRPGESYESVWRLLINSTIGIGGLFDVASHMGLERRTNDFGITLSTWGFSTAPYLVVPFFGPTNIRDGLGVVTDYAFFTVWPYMDNVALRNVLLGLDAVRIRSNLLDTETILNTAAFDKYTLTRDAYVQYRYQLVKNHGGDYSQGETYHIDDDALLVDPPEGNQAKPPLLPAKNPDTTPRTDMLNKAAQQTVNSHQKG